MLQFVYESREVTGEVFEATVIKEDFTGQVDDCQEAQDGFVVQFDYENREVTGEVFEATVIKEDFTVRFNDRQNEEFQV